MRVTVERPHANGGDAFRCVYVWYFQLQPNPDMGNKLELVLTSYGWEVQKTKRHKPTASLLYSRFRQDSIAESSVPMPDDVVAEAKAKAVAEFAETLWVGRWKTDLGHV